MGTSGVSFDVLLHQSSLTKMGVTRVLLLLSVVLAAALANDGTEQDELFKTPVYGTIEGCEVKCWGEGYRRHPSDCHKFVRCTKGGPQVMNCPNGTMWDHAERTCNHDHATECRVGYYDHPDGGRCPGRCHFECETPNGKFPHPRDCHRYFQCRDGVPTYRGCRWYQHFDVITGNCVNKAEATCTASADSECRGSIL